MAATDSLPWCPDMLKSGFCKRGKACPYSHDVPTTSAGGTSLSSATTTAPSRSLIESQSSSSSASAAPSAVPFSTVAAPASSSASSGGVADLLAMILNPSSVPSSAPLSSSLLSSTPLSSFSPQPISTPISFSSSLSSPSSISSFPTTSSPSLPINNTATTLSTIQALLASVQQPSQPQPSYAPSFSGWQQSPPPFPQQQQPQPSQLNDFSQLLTLLQQQPLQTTSVAAPVFPISSYQQQPSFSTAVTPPSQKLEEINQQIQQLCSILGQFTSTAPSSQPFQTTPSLPSISSHVPSTSGSSYSPAPYSSFEADNSYLPPSRTRPLSSSSLSSSHVYSAPYHDKRAVSEAFSKAPAKRTKHNDEGRATNKTKHVSIVERWKRQKVDRKEIASSLKTKSAKSSMPTSALLTKPAKDSNSTPEATDTPSSTSSISAPPLSSQETSPSSTSSLSSNSTDISQPQTQVPQRSSTNGLNNEQQKEKPQTPVQPSSSSSSSSSSFSSSSASSSSSSSREPQRITSAMLKAKDIISKEQYPFVPYEGRPKVPRSFRQKMLDTLLQEMFIQELNSRLSNEGEAVKNTPLFEMDFGEVVLKAVRLEEELYGKCKSKVVYMNLCSQAMQSIKSFSSS